MGRRLARSIPTSFESVLIRADGSLKLQIDSETQLAAQESDEPRQPRRGVTRRRFEILPESEGVLRDYIERSTLAMGATIQVEEVPKPATVEIVYGLPGTDNRIELRAPFRFQKSTGRSSRGVLVVEVHDGNRIAFPTPDPALSAGVKLPD